MIDYFVIDDFFCAVADIEFTAGADLNMHTRGGIEQPHLTVSTHLIPIWVV